jgi:DNA-binding NarL/FixJ family response regulator
VDNPPAPIDAIGPTVAVTAPRFGETQRGAFALSAVAFDNVGVTRVKWYVDGSEAAFDGDGAPWTRSWDSRQLVNGAHRVFAKARDAAGNWSSSASITFTTDNAPCGTASASPATWDHVVWIVFENKSYSQIINAPEAPYLTDLAAKCGLATDYHGLAHPSLPNYIAMTSGGTQGITDDKRPHALFVTGLVRLLAERGVTVVGTARSGEEALDLVGRLDPDVVLMDVSLPGMSGVEATRRLRRAHDGICIVVLTVMAEEAMLMEAIQAGAVGYLLKEAPVDDIVGGLQAARSGGSLLAPEVAGKLLRRIRKGRGGELEGARPGLTHREREVLDLVVEGYDNAEIA